MNRKTRSICMVAAAMMLPVVTALHALAAPTPVGQMKFDGLLRSNSQGGGEFKWNVKPTGGSTGLTFEPVGFEQHGAGTNEYLTFCVEISEHVGSGGVYDAFLNTTSVGTGVALKSETAFLYTEFVKGTLTGYFGANRDAEAKALQYAIWSYQDPSNFVASWVTTAGVETEYLALKALATTAIGTSSWSGGQIGNVRILNLNDPTTGAAKQDQLVMIPLPSPVWMAGIGLFGVAGGSIYRRRAGKTVTNSI